MQVETKGIEGSLSLTRLAGFVWPAIQRAVGPARCDRCITILYFAYLESKKRYAGNVLGLLWSVLSPLAQLGTYVFVFAVVLNLRFAKPNGEVVGTLDYAFYVLLGLIAWQFMTGSVSGGLNMVKNYSGFIKQPNFPYRILPTVMVLSATPAHLMGLLVLFVLALFSDQANTVRWLLLPVVYTVLFAFICGLSTALGFLVVKLPDIRHATPLMLHLLLFLSPVFYKPEQVPEAFRFISYANPLAYYVSVFKYVFTGDRSMCIVSPHVDLVAFALCSGVLWSSQRLLLKKIRMGGLDHVA